MYIKHRVKYTKDDYIQKHKYRQYRKLMKRSGYKTTVLLEMCVGSLDQPDQKRNGENFHMVRHSYRKHLIKFLLYINRNSRRMHCSEAVLVIYRHTQKHRD